MFTRWCGPNQNHRETEVAWAFCFFLPPLAWQHNEPSISLSDHLLLRMELSTWLPVVSFQSIFSPLPVITFFCWLKRNIFRCSAFLATKTKNRKVAICSFDAFLQCRARISSLPLSFESQAPSIVRTIIFIRISRNKSLYYSFTARCEYKMAYQHFMVGWTRANFLSFPFFPKSQKYLISSHANCSARFSQLTFWHLKCAKLAWTLDKRLRSGLVSIFLNK